MTAEPIDVTELSSHATIVATLTDSWPSVGLGLYVTVFDAALGRLLIASGQPDQARDRLDAALRFAEESGMHFYEAELLRLRAHTHADPDLTREDLSAARELAGRQGMHLFELRAALDDFDLHGEPARAAVIDVVSRIPAASSLPELTRAQAALELNPSSD